jgi:hypothetical protein
MQGIAKRVWLIVIFALIANAFGGQFPIPSCVNRTCQAVSCCCSDRSTCCETKGDCKDCKCVVQGEVPPSAKFAVATVGHSDLPVTMPAAVFPTVLTVVPAIILPVGDDQAVPDSDHPPRFGRAPPVLLEI